jgi:hypothetical protein
LTLLCCSRALFTASNTGLKGKLEQRKEEMLEKEDDRILIHVKNERKKKCMSVEQENIMNLL